MVLLKNMYEAFRDTCLRHYKLDPVHFYTSPGLAWKACLKQTGIRLELLTNPDMLLMFERGIRGGITQAVHKYTSANNKYMGDRFDPKSESSYLQYLAGVFKELTSSFFPRLNFPSEMRILLLYPTVPNLILSSMSLGSI